MEAAIAALKSRGTEKNREGMARFGIATLRAFGVSMPDIRACAANITKDHALALALWQSGFHEARIMAGLIDQPQWVTPPQMNAWTGDFDSWDLCDQICGNLWDRTAFAHEKILEWSSDPREFVKRAAFATIAWRAVHDKKTADAVFLEYLPLIKREAGDSRNFVCKAVNWALRQTGKRSARLNLPCLELARELAASPHKTARWNGIDASRELSSEKLQKKLGLAST